MCLPCTARHPSDSFPGMCGEKLTDWVNCVCSVCSYVHFACADVGRSIYTSALCAAQMFLHKLLWLDQVNFVWKSSSSWARRLLWGWRITRRNRAVPGICHSAELPRWQRTYISNIAVSWGIESSLSTFNADAAFSVFLGLFLSLELVWWKNFGVSFSICYKFGEVHFYSELTIIQ